MRTIASIFVLFFLAISPTIQAQDILGAARQITEMEDEQSGEDNSENTQSQQSPEQQERQDEWQRNWEDTKKYYENLDAFDTPQLRCLILVFAWDHDYLKIVEATNRATECQMKYDLYGMQLLMTSIGQSIAHCAEEINNLSESESVTLRNKFYEILSQNGTIANILLEASVDIVDLSIDDLSREQVEQIEELMSSDDLNAFDKIFRDFWYVRNQRFPYNPDNMNDRYEENVLSLYYLPLTPEYYLWSTYRTGQKMEALGCGG